MTQQADQQYQPASAPEQRNSGWASGLTTFAGVIMIMGGIFQALVGVVALFQDEFYVKTRNYTFKFDVTTWGWIHLLLGAAVALAGFAVLSGRTWARIVGIILAVLSALANFTFVPYYPFWSLLIIALDVFVIWALAVYRPDA